MFKRSQEKERIKVGHLDYSRVGLQLSHCIKKADFCACECLMTSLITSSYQQNNKSSSSQKTETFTII